jgi:hypothetical protein
VVFSFLCRSLTLHCLTLVLSRLVLQDYGQAPTKTLIFRRYALAWWQEDEDDRLVTSPLQRAIRKVSYTQHTRTHA